jgi:uncharacterized protein (DUF1800 family)
MGIDGSVTHLLRRAGLGPTAAEAAAASARGFGATVDALIAGLGAPDPGGDAVPLPTLGSPLTYERQLRQARQSGDTATKRAIALQLSDEHRQLTSWWLSRMVATSNPLAEKLTFLLHGHFPTAISKVRFPAFMYGQNQLFRTAGSGNFDALTQAVAADPAMLIWLDASSDKAADPNENFARELMERFTMGIGTYHEADVRAAAYCFTGWRLDLATGGLVIDAKNHSPVVQQVLGTPVNTGAQVIDLVTHSPASARYVPAAFWSHLAYPVPPSDPVVSDLATGYATDLDVGNLLRAIFEHPEFISSAAMAGLVKQPCEYVVGAVRALGVAPAEVTGTPELLQATMAAMGQVLFDPPSVGGWSQNQYWLSTAAALARWKFARRLTAGADLSPVADASPASRTDAVAELLSVHGWSDTTAAALGRAGGDPTTLTTLALVSPEYVNN